MLSGVCLHRRKGLECVKSLSDAPNLLADGDFLTSLQIGFFSTLRHVECLESFCSDSNRRGFRRKIIHMITGSIQAMIHDSIFWWSRSMLVIAHNKRSHECCCRPTRLIIMENHDFMPRHACLLCFCTHGSTPVFSTTPSVLELLLHPYC